MALLIIGGVILGVIIFLFLFVLIIRARLKSELGSQYKELISAIKDMPNLQKEKYTEDKSIGGITNLILPNIRKDFKDFNLNVLFSKVKEDITSALNIISNFDKKSAEKDSDLILIRDYLLEKLKDYEENERKETFQDIEVKKSSLHSYKKENGTATIEVSSNVSYYYQTNDKNIKTYQDVKKTVRIDTEYVYVYDESKFKENASHFSIHCPNCGAPITDLSGTCYYCTAHMEPINLKAWKINKIEIK